MCFYVNWSISRTHIPRPAHLPPVSIVRWQEVRVLKQVNKVPSRHLLRLLAAFEDEVDGGLRLTIVTELYTGQDVRPGGGGI
jgi:hypothetical protein